MKTVWVAQVNVPYEASDMIAIAATKNLAMRAAEAHFREQNPRNSRDWSGSMADRWEDAVGDAVYFDFKYSSGDSYWVVYEEVLVVE